MKTTVKFLGLDSCDYAVVSVETPGAIAYAVYCPTKMEVIEEINFNDTMGLTEVYNPLGVSDEEAIIEWFESVLED